MVRNYLAFQEFFDLYHQRAQSFGYRALICLVARYADAPWIYNELVEFWSSFHDLTGSKVAFVFAGEPVSLNLKFESFAWNESGQDFYSPAGVAVKDADKLLLTHDEDGISRAIEIAPRAPDKHELRTNHTLRIEEIKTTLGIEERDIPGLYFSYLRSKSTQLIPLSTTHSPLYNRFKILMRGWDPIFKQSDLEWREHARLRQKLNVAKSRSGQINRRLRNIESIIGQLSLPKQRVAEDVLEAIYKIPNDSSSRKEAFYHLRLLRRMYTEHANRRIFSELNAMIDLIPFFDEIMKETVQAKVELEKFEKSMSDSEPQLIDVAMEAFSDVNRTENAEIPNTNRQYVQLIETIRSSFNLEELADLCFLINIDFEDLPLERRSSTIRELVGHMKRRNQIPLLVENCKQLRPGIKWPDVDL